MPLPTLGIAAALSQAMSPFGSKIEKMEKPSEHPSFGQRADRYWVESRRPLASLVFVAPLLILYEIGVLWLGVHPNGADAFLQRLLELLGFGQHLLAPVVLVLILLGWHYLTREPWQLSGGMISAMAAECLVLGLCLRVVAFVQDALLALNIGDAVRNAIGYLGAGIYEELLFRLILLSLLAWAFRKAGIAPRPSMIVAVAVSSLLFAAAHNVGPYGEAFLWQRFVFRGLAGVFFSAVFLYRGFGIAAGSHAAYDILLGVF